MRYLSTFSGIEAASVAWDPLGWTPIGFSEIEAFPSEVLGHHFPNVPNYGDITGYKNWPDLNVQLLVGGSPCQSFSIAGLRKGLADPRGNLIFSFLGVALRYRPKWVIWENVPGVLSADGGRAFGSMLGGLAELGYGFAYRVLDAQYVRTQSHPGAVPQRRRRVFVVGYLGDWRPAAAVLFERESLLGHPPPSRKAREGIAGGVAPSIDASDGKKWGANQWVDGGKAVIQPHIIHGTQDPCVSDIAFAQGRNNGGENVLIQQMAVRRLTPTECERLQGFPDGWTDIPWRGKETSPDGPRYKALGNSMAVNVMRWIGDRIQHVEELHP